MNKLSTVLPKNDSSRYASYGRDLIQYTRNVLYVLCYDSNDVMYNITKKYMKVENARTFIIFCLLKS
jgi:hypothetical protein